MARNQTLTPIVLADFEHAKCLLLVGHLCSAKTRAQKKKEAFPTEKIANAINKADVIWSKMRKEITADVIAYGQVNVRYAALQHNPNNMNSVTAIYTKVVPCTIA